MNTSRSEPVSPEAILGIDNVSIELPVAGVGSRVLAAFFDYVLVFLLSIMWVIGGVIFAHSIGLGGGLTFAVVVCGLFLVDWGYFAGSEIATGGKTFGKTMLGLRVVNRTGGRPSTSALLLRNLVRTPDLLVGVLLMASDDLARRIGDRLAGTLVVHQPRRRAETTLRRLPRGWGAKEVAALETFIGRRRELEPERAQALAQKFVGLIQRDDPTFLDGIDIRSDPMQVLLRATQAENIERNQ